MATYTEVGFPYGDDRYFSPRTDGILVEGGPEHTFTLAPPNGTEKNPVVSQAVGGDEMDYIGGTTCIAATNINYNQMAGSD